MESGTRMGRPCRTGEAGYLFAFLASDQASFITGQSIAVDGGFSL
jgi:NAD(P)-dependent dehydrogenase (short-subunit alcohol dehydrogenase family)